MASLTLSQTEIESAVRSAAKDVARGFRAKGCRTRCMGWALAVRGDTVQLQVTYQITDKDGTRSEGLFAVALA